MRSTFLENKSRALFDQLVGVDGRYISFNLSPLFQMSLATVGPSTNYNFDDDLQLYIVGLATEYPPFQNGPDVLEALARKHYPDSNA